MGGLGKVPSPKLEKYRKDNKLIDGWPKMSSYSPREIKLINTLPGGAYDIFFTNIITAQNLT